MATHAATPGEVNTQPETSREAHWRLVTRFCFRFFFIYFVLYTFPFPLYYIPGSDRIFDKYTKMWHAIDAWAGKHILHLSSPITVFANGSGDTTSDYVQALCYLIITAVALAVWSVFDRKRGDYQRLYRWLRLYVRVVLGSALLSYGAYKVIKSQFPPLLLTTLMKPYGDSSPMGLLWSFMGYSGPYTVFTGTVEMLAGTLLFVPRLATLGGLVAAGAMTNVFMLNMSYDVPVKLYSFHLLAMSVFVVAPDLSRLASFFILNRKVEPSPNPPFFQRLWLNRSLLGLQLAMCVMFAGLGLFQSYKAAKQYGFLATRPPLYGIWSVEEFNVDGVPRPPLLTDELRWQCMVLDRLPTFVAFQKMNGKIDYYGMALDLGKKTLSLKKRIDPKWKSDFTVDRPQPDVMFLDGKMDGHQIHAKLHLEPEGKYLLVSRGFHWINEYPFNR